MLKIKDKTINVLYTMAVLVLYIGALLNADLIYLILGNQLMMIMLLLNILYNEKVE